VCRINLGCVCVFVYVHVCVCVCVCMYVCVCERERENVCEYAYQSIISVYVMWIWCDVVCCAVCACTEAFEVEELVHPDVGLIRTKAQQLNKKLVQCKTELTQAQVR